MAIAKEQLRQIIKENNIQNVGDIYSLLKDSFKDMMQEMLEAEMDVSLGYPKNDKGNLLIDNKRNGYTPKTVKSQFGEFEVDVPRDRNAEFEPKIISKYQRDVSGIEDNDGQHELNVAAGGLVRPIENIVATIMHEAVHIYCMQNSIKDTSNNHVYHNKKFKEIAEQHGLLIERHEKYRYTLTTPSQKLIDYCKEQGFEDLHIYRKEEGQPIGKGLGGITGGDDGAGTAAPTRKSSTRKYVCDCGISVRATKEVYIICGNCMAVMKEDM